ncbi:transposable element Tcb2 transposase [Trichonephila clavipes]|nr:transposable element Tcb2 transposase [Trichonephila clavipes]
MPLHSFRRQYEQLSQFERVRIIGMMEAGWSARRLARQLGRSDCVVRRYWDQWIRELSFSRRPGSERPQQTSRRKDRDIVRNSRVQSTVSSAAIQAPITFSLGAPVSSRTIRRRLDEGHLGSQRPLRVLLLMPTYRRLRLEWCRARENRTAAEWNQIVCSDAREREREIENPYSISAVMTIVFVSEDPEVNASILPFFTATHLSHS